LSSAIDKAKEHDNSVVIEEGLEGAREIEVAVMGNTELTISRPGEIIASKAFYDYDDKYKLGEAKSMVPADLTEQEEEDIMGLSSKLYKLCKCSGFCRIDFMIKGGEIYVNEINTLPGFTDISMFPMMMKEYGISYKDMISAIIELAY